MADIWVGCGLLGLSVGDIRKRSIPLWEVLVFLFVGIIYGLWKNGVVEVLSGFLPGVLLCVAAMVMPDDVGMGDGIVTVVYGSIYGWQKACLWLVISFFLVAIGGVLLCVIQQRKRVRLPFVPFLTAVHVGMCL